jgi:hypothetical protein
MKDWFRQKVRELFDDPLGTAIRWVVYLILLGVAVWLLVWAVRWVFGFVGSAFR